jgi:hypothetical protein
MQRQILLTLALLGAGVSALRGQVVDTVITHIDTVVVAPEAVAGVGEAPEVELPMSPRGAFIRSMVIPGWGQSAFGAYTRGGIYFAGWTGNWFMNFKNHVRLHEARNRLDLRTAQVRDSLIYSPPEPGAPPNPDSMRAVLDTTNLLQTTVRQDPIGSDLQGLVSSREQQREDWIAWSLFWILASGIDAYVTAHLADFPATIELEPNLDRSVSVRVEVPLPRRRP